MADADAQSLETILTRDAALLQETVRDAGALARSMFRTELKTWTKGASSPVSEADIAVNDLLEARLRAATPDYGWLSEESADDAARLARRLTWIVDPIDGTRNYLGGHDEWCVSVALVEDAAPVLAAVFAPVSDEFFFAARGRGTTLNGQAVRAAGGSALDFSRVAGPKPMVERLNVSGGDIKLHPRIGSLALRLCRVAHGGLDAAFAGGNSHDWDLAAADLIVQEADGRMSDLSGDPILYNRREVTHGVLVAAGRDRHASIVAHFRNRPLP
ncbi:3'(2'),5'-bisphosphate nucleotidase CysQ [Bradyrhizobium diazoefficiens]|nr:3'(2'),5'-bisphosphate nucleotidase CysQ [Bradyrhizobium diazoefficiens]UCF53131.1 MAG: 3'(2'),5'-bisphosphate nucleotidase CysQ [Bradyrhizobium sp.]MBR0965130.1 3'(2'),5'-bisphosphate nucleotidase CysQ [Bradyrhizobium diazoefficiens]MBR0977527.1 3'(2'),5'-bisphosphate nucleotidase CysQ [Bradyrhizobium diazoefficiens]MBR1007791.1 3'(2'),5'-bisphosphate nucleotidase CysQ [Bradyrhizobium diazoefficiens]MBR1013592.1 3'(2'),5'-bisphosphate nucleotidase CysQ [Bradyrhizobium diazoefficiens]